jgi:hypothetical protein
MKIYGNYQYLKKKKKEKKSKCNNKGSNEDRMNDKRQIEER